MAEKYISQFTGQEIDERLAAVSEKYGYINVRADNSKNVYVFDCYASEQDYLDGNEPLNSIDTPIASTKGTAYTAFLTGSIANTVDLVVAEKKLEVALNYRAVQIVEGLSNNANAVGTVVVQRQTATTDWTTVGEIKNILPSSEPTDTTTTTTVDIGEFISKGKQNIRLLATYVITDEETGEQKTIRSGYVMVGQSVNYVELRLETTTSYHVPMNAYNEETGALETFKVDYRVYGAVSKTLYVKVKGAKGVNTVTSYLSASEDGTTKGIALDENVAYEYMTHGVREVTAWLECQDGLGGTIQSESVTNQFMMVNPQSANYDATKKYLLLQNVDSSITNFIQSKLANYSVYATDGSDTEITFKLTDALENSYTEVIKTVSPNTPNELLMSAQIEPSDEGSIQDEYKTRFYVFKGEENFIQSSGHSYDDPSKLRSYYDVTVDNREAVYPVLGATFLLNPKNRDNSEENPKVIYNEKANNAIVEAEFENFGLLHDLWVTDESGNKVLRVMAGEKLTIKRNIWRQFKTNPNSSLTIDIDYKISNVTNLTDPVVSILGGTNKGIMLNALSGWVKTASYNETDNCNFHWREDKKQYLSVNIHNEVYPKKQGVEDVKYTSEQAAQAGKSLAIARVLLNGDPVREIPFKTDSTTEWCDDDNAAIIIGNEGADIDIYSIRIYENRQVDWVDLLNRNYISSLFTTEEKQRQKAKNDLLTGGIISLEKAKQAGLNCIVYHGKRPFYYESGNGTGWVEYFRYDMEGKALPELSGTNCKNSAELSWKGQGSTAMLYDEFNQQDDNSKVKAMVEIPVGQFHDSIHVSEPYEVEVTDEEGNITGTKQVVDIYGGNLGKNFPLTNDTATYDYKDGKVLVTDGWIDGNGKYRGAGYKVSEDVALAQKKVAKINYASAMQSHLPAACKSYDELHYECVGASPLQQQYLELGLTRPVSAKHIEPFLMFFNETGKMVDGKWVEDESRTYFTGLCTYGAGKMDKVSWGYVKKKHPMFAMIEGSDNNLPLTDFRVPWDDKVTYSTSEEGFIYNGYTSWDFDAGKTDDNDIPDATLVKQLKRFHNFVYLNSTNIKYYVGTMAQFKALPEGSVDIESKYWCTDGEDAFRLLRYDYTQPEGLRWVDAGLNEAVVDLSTDIRTKATYENYKNSTAYDEMNEAFKADFAKFMKTHGDYLIKLRSLLFNYVYVLMFLAGTDNSSKNTYYKLDPIAQKMARNDEFAVWWSANFGEEFDFDNVYQIFLDGDDMDSILPVNNKGNLTKPYYIERLYPYADGGTENLYEGTKNQLFNFVEIGYSVLERSEMMNLILQKLQGSVKESDKLLGLADNRVSAWGGLHKYFFNIQYYFPQICYIEQARIRYEFAELIGHSGARGVKPLSQSIGSQLENEQQFMEQRLVYMASFGNFGELGDTKSGSVGLTDAGVQLQFQAAPLPDGSAATIELTVTPHQYIYPCGFDGQTTKPTYQRTSPKQTCVVRIAENVTKVSDTTMGLRGANYYSDYGNLGTLSTTSAFTVNGKRLKRLTVTTFLSFRPIDVQISAANIQRVDVMSLSGNVAIFDVSMLKRLEFVSTISTFVAQVVYPRTHTLKEVRVGGRNLEKIEINDCPNLNVFYTHQTGYEYYFRSVKEVIIGENVGNISRKVIDVLTEAKLIGATSNTVSLETLIVKNIGNPAEGKGWSDLDANIMEWLSEIPTCELKGTISIKEDHPQGLPRITWDLKNKINAKFGNVDSHFTQTYNPYKGLLLTYQKRDINAEQLKIKGNFYVEAGNTFKFEVRPYSQYENNFTWIRYFLKDGVSGIRISDTGIITVSTLNNTKTYATIVGRVYYAEGGAIYSHDVEKTIEIWNRPAQLGDLVYADGTFSSAEMYEGEKTPIGICFYVPPRDENGNVLPKFANADDKQLRLMVALEETNVPIDGALTSSLQWGATPPMSNQTDEWHQQSALYHLDAEGNRVNLTSSKVPSVYDIQAVRNLTTRGLANKYIDPDPTTNHNGESDYRDLNTNDGLLNDGFKCVTPNLDMGDGFAYNEGEMSFNSVGERTLTSGLAKLAGDGYAEGDIVNSGYAKTLKVIAHRNDLLNNDIIGADGEVVYQGGTLPLPTASGSTTEMKALGTLIDQLCNWASQSNGLNDPYPKKWQQLAYPFVSACYAYQPTKTLLDGELLADKFKAHNWFAPTEGQLARICWYAKFGEKGGFDVFKVARDKGLLGKLTTTSSTYWSVTEYNSHYAWYVHFGSSYTYLSGKDNSYVGRAVAAF